MSFSAREGGAVPGTAAFLPCPPHFASLSFSLSSQQPRRRRVAFHAPFASASAARFGAAATEPATGLAYPDHLCVLTSKHCPQLAGVGVRAKRILGLKNINVYTVGLYVDASGAKKALHKHKGASPDALMASQAAMDELVASQQFEKSLRLVISFGGLKRATFLTALEERLVPSLNKAKEPAGTIGAFKALFDGASFAKGTEIAFASHKGELVTQIDGKKVGTIASAALTKALFNIYVGADPVSHDAKRAFCTGLSALLSE